MKKLQHLNHKNIIKYYGHWEDTTDKQCYIFLELCTREHLGKRIHQKLSEECTFKWFSQLVDGMIFIHSQSNHPTTQIFSIEISSQLTCWLLRMKMKLSKSLTSGLPEMTFSWRRLARWEPMRIRPPKLLEEAKEARSMTKKWMSTVQVLF